MKWRGSFSGDKEIDRPVQMFAETRSTSSLLEWIYILQSTHLSGASGTRSQLYRRRRGPRKITPGIMKAFRALLDFIYLAQLEAHTTDTIQQLRGFLATLHENKHHLTAAGIRDGPRQKGEFHIPKLELMNHVADLIQHLGSVLQYSTEHTERCHITMAKQPYRSTNKKDYKIQICLILDRRDKIDLFATFLEWKIQENSKLQTRESPAVSIPALGVNDISGWQLQRENFLPFRSSLHTPSFVETHFMIIHCLRP